MRDTGSRGPAAAQGWSPRPRTAPGTTAAAGRSCSHCIPGCPARKPGYERDL